MSTEDPYRGRVWALALLMAGIDFAEGGCGAIGDRAGVNGQADRQIGDEILDRLVGDHVARTGF